MPPTSSPAFARPSIAAARRVAASWTSGFAEVGAPPSAEIDRCAALLGGALAAAEFRPAPR